MCVCCINITECKKNLEAGFRHRTLNVTVSWMHLFVSFLEGLFISSKCCLQFKLKLVKMSDVLGKHSVLYILLVGVDLLLFCFSNLNCKFPFQNLRGKVKKQRDSCTKQHFRNLLMCELLVKSLKKIYIYKKKQCWDVLGTPFSG